MVSTGQQTYMPQRHNRAYCRPTDNTCHLLASSTLHTRAVQENDSNTRRRLRGNSVAQRALGFSRRNAMFLGLVGLVFAAIVTAAQLQVADHASSGYDVSPASDVTRVSAAAAIPLNRRRPTSSQQQGRSRAVRGSKAVASDGGLQATQRKASTSTTSFTAAASPYARHGRPLLNGQRQKMPVNTLSPSNSSTQSQKTGSRKQSDVVDITTAKLHIGNATTASSLPKGEVINTRSTSALVSSLTQSRSLAHPMDGGLGLWGLSRAGKLVRKVQFLFLGF